MNSLFAGIHLQDKTNEILALNDVDFEQNVSYLKSLIASKIANNSDFNAKNLEIIYKGLPLCDDDKLETVVRPFATVHCFKKTKQYEPYVPSDKVKDPKYLAEVQNLFTLTAHLQINVTSRVNILQKIVAEYPEFRRNLGAQALIRDSVLFNTLHQPEVVKKIAETYPIIVEAARFIVDTVKKELTRSSHLYSEPNTDSTNSSEEENSLGASSSSSERRANDASSGSQSESARIRQISRQQLQSALAQMGFSSVNSLSSIAQRNSDANTSSSSLSNSTSGERISSDMFRSELQRALSTFNPRTNNATDTAATATTTTANTTTTTTTTGTSATPMDIAEPNSSSLTNATQDTNEDSGDIPLYYRTHQYAEQLRTMVQMGFINYEENLIYLNLTNGNIENAVNLLMGAMN